MFLVEQSTGKPSAAGYSAVLGSVIRFLAHFTVLQGHSVFFQVLVDCSMLPVGDLGVCMGFRASCSTAGVQQPLKPGGSNICGFLQT